MSPPIFRAHKHKHGFTSCITVTFSVLRPSNRFRKSLKAFIDTKKKPEGELQMGGFLFQERTDVQRTSALTSVTYTVSREEVCGPRCPPLLQRSGPLIPRDLMDRIQDRQNWSDTRPAPPVICTFI